MRIEPIKIFDSKKNKGIRDFDKYLDSKIFLLLTIFIILVLFFYFELSFEDGFFLYLSLAVLLLYFLIFSIIGFYIKRILKITIFENSIKFLYKTGFGTNESSWALKDCKIQLFELKSHRAQFVGLEMDFKNKNSGLRFKLLEKNWDYEEMENIYTEIKKLKNEEIPESDKDAFRQLQIMNNTLTEEK